MASLTAKKLNRLVSLTTTSPLTPEALTKKCGGLFAFLGRLLILIKNKLIKLFRGKTKLMYWKGDTAREVRDGGIVILTDSASVVPLRNDSSDRAIGIARRNDTVTDSALVPIEVPVENAVEWEIDLDSDAGAADTDIGKYCAIDTAGGNSVLAGDSVGMRADVSDTSIRQILILGRVGTTKIIGSLAITAWDKSIGDSLIG